ncbi:MAG TPA: hypothetical protein VGO57_14575 [Verrucomicrobiae bacterium]
MTKKNWLYLTVLLALAAVYVVFFTDWFKPQTVQIFHTVREAHFRRRPGHNTPTLLFGLSRPLKITDIKIVPLADYEKNPDTLPVWHLISDSNSVPIHDFAYGQKIRGMKAAVRGSEAGELDTNLVYRIFVVAGKVTGHEDFHLGDEPATNAVTSGK